MTIAALITEGIGPGGSVLYILTGGLSLGAVASIWIPDSPVTTNWTQDGAVSATWTPDPLLTPDWTSA